MFDRNEFVADCIAAVRDDPTHMTVAAAMREVFADTNAILRDLGTPVAAGIDVLHAAPDLTILNVVWKPGMSVLPHNHEMWAVIGIYGGREDNIFWRRVPGAPDGRLEAAGAKALCTGDVAPLGHDIIHSVLNPIDQLSGAIHVYGGAFFDQPRSEWDAENLTERPLDIARVRAQFAPD